MRREGEMDYYMMDHYTGYRKVKKISTFGESSNTLWYYNGDLIHRDYDKPAVINEVFYDRPANEIIHDKPTNIKSKLVRKEWRNKGLLHRKNDKPAIEYVDRNGEKVIHKKKEWYLDGKKHRDGDLPAVVEFYDEIGEKEYFREWWIEGKLLKIESPKRWTKERFNTLPFFLK